MSRQAGRFSKPGWGGRRLALSGILALFATAAYAGNVLPVPAVTIYPGDIIKENAIVDRDFGDGGPMRGAAIDSARGAYRQDRPAHFAPRPPDLAQCRR